MDSIYKYIRFNNPGIWQVAFAGGNLNNGSIAGVSYLNANNDSGNANSNIGAQLSSIKRWLLNPASWQKTKHQKGTGSHWRKFLKEEQIMKRISGVFNKICTIENLKLAHKNARKGKLFYTEVKEIDANPEKYLNELLDDLKNNQFKTAEYEIFEKQCGKKNRVIYKLPYYPDRIVHHAIMNILEPLWMKVFITDTYSSMKGRGIHFGMKRVEKAIRNDKEGTKYCLKIDIKKFYPNIDNEILKKIVRRKIKDTDFLNLLDSIIDSEKGLPIGNYLSQYLANLYLAYFDHDVKEKMGVKYYFRYCDDIVILHHNKQLLHGLLVNINHYLNDQLNLQIKPNFQVFPVEKRGIDFMGYVFYPTHTRIRKSIKKDMIKKLIKNPNMKTAAAYYGWLKHADCFNLRTKYLQEYESKFKHAS